MANINTYKRHYCSGKYDCSIIYTDWECQSTDCSWNGTSCMGKGSCQEYYNNTGRCLTLNGCIADEDIQLQNIIEHPYTSTGGEIANIDYGYSDGNEVRREQGCEGQCCVNSCNFQNSGECSECQCCGSSVDEGGGGCVCAPWSVGTMAVNKGDGTGPGCPAGYDCNGVCAGPGSQWFGGGCTSNNQCCGGYTCVPVFDVNGFLNMECRNPGYSLSPCFNGNDCQSDYCEQELEPDEDYGQCAAQGGGIEGTLCYDDVFCENGLYCISNECSIPSADGGVCNDDIDHCEDALICWDSTCEPPHDNGEECGSGSDCSSHNCYFGECQAGTTGDPCTYGYHCINYCYSLTCWNGDIGDSCAYNYHCEDAGGTCINNICTELADDGGDCESDDDCEAGLYCISSECSEPLDVCSVCEENYHCEGDLVCNYTSSWPADSYTDDFPLVCNLGGGNTVGHCLPLGQEGDPCIDYGGNGSDLLCDADNYYDCHDPQFGQPYCFYNEDLQGDNFFGEVSLQFTNANFDPTYWNEVSSEQKFFDIQIINTVSVSEFSIGISGIEIIGISNSMGFGNHEFLPAFTESVTDNVIHGVTDGVAGPAYWTVNTTYTDFLRVLFDFLPGEDGTSEVDWAGVTFKDVDGFDIQVEVSDGIPIVVSGCTDSAYQNYNPNATTDDGNCNNNVALPDNTFHAGYSPVTTLPTPFYQVSVYLECLPGESTEISGDDYDAVTNFKIKYPDEGTALEPTGYLSVGGIEYSQLALDTDEDGFITVVPYETDNKYRVDIEYKPDNFFTGTDVGLEWKCTAEEAPYHTDITYTILAEYEFRIGWIEDSSFFGFGSNINNISVISSLSNSYDPYSGIDIVSSLFDNTTDSFEYADFDKRPSLGLFYPKDKNELSDDFSINIPESVGPFSQLTNPNLITNGQGKFGTIVSFYNAAGCTDNLNSAGDGPWQGYEFAAGDLSCWFYSDADMIADELYTCDDEGSLESDGSTANEACCVCGGGTKIDNKIFSPNTGHDTTRGYGWGYINYKDVPSDVSSYSEFSAQFNNEKMYTGLYEYGGISEDGLITGMAYPFLQKGEWAYWKKDYTECYSYDRCLVLSASSNYQSGQGFTESGHQYRTLNQYQKIVKTGDTQILPFSSLKVSFRMKTLSIPDATNPPMVEASITRGGDPGRGIVTYDDAQAIDGVPFPAWVLIEQAGSADWGEPLGGSDYYDPSGNYNSVLGSSNFWRGSSIRVSNTTTDKWEKFEYTFNLHSSYTDSVGNMKNLYFLIQAGNNFEGEVLLDDFAVTEGYDFIPDVDVRSNKGINNYGTGTLTEYYDPKIDLQKFNDTTAPLEAQFYFYPRYNHELVFDIEKDIIHNDFREGMFYLYDVDWGDDSQREYNSEPLKLGNNVMVYHTYETSGIYEVTGYMLRMKPDLDLNEIGVLHNKRFTLRININEGLDEDFRYFGSDGFSFIPYKNTLPVIGGYNKESIYYKSVKRQLGFISDDIKVSTGFKKTSDKLKTEVALQKMDGSNTPLEVLPHFSLPRYSERAGDLPDVDMTISMAGRADGFNQVTQDIYSDLFSEDINGFGTPPHFNIIVNGYPISDGFILNPYYTGGTAAYEDYTFQIPISLLQNVNEIRVKYDNNGTSPFIPHIWQMFDGTIQLGGGSVDNGDTNLANSDRNLYVTSLTINGITFDENTHEDVSIIYDTALAGGYYLPDGVTSGGGMPWDGNMIYTIPLNYFIDIDTDITYSGDLVYSGSLHSSNVEELGNSIGDVDLTNIRYFDEPKDMWEMLGEFADMIGGCIDDTACNYNPLANIDDESCLYNDCAGECGGNTIIDCAGVCGGGLVYDDCGVCDGDNSSCSDCAGVPNGDGVDLGCGCNEPTPLYYCNDTDGDGFGSGTPVEYCLVDVPDGWVTDCSDDCDCEFTPSYDCAGVCCGSSDTDQCGICGGDGSDDLGCGCFVDGPSGCDDTCGSTLELDDCGICGGTNSCLGCDGAANSGLVNDECGVCGGSGIPEGNCDCLGNVFDDCGMCGGDNSTCLDPNQGDYCSQQYEFGSENYNIGGEYDCETLINYIIEPDFFTAECTPGTTITRSTPYGDAICNCNTPSDDSVGEGWDTAYFCSAVHVECHYCERTDTCTEIENPTCEDEHDTCEEQGLIYCPGTSTQPYEHCYTQELIDTWWTQGSTYYADTIDEWDGCPVCYDDCDCPAGRSCHTSGLWCSADVCWENGSQCAAGYYCDSWMWDSTTGIGDDGYGHPWYGGQGSEALWGQCMPAAGDGCHPEHQMCTSGDECGRNQRNICDPDTPGVSCCNGWCTTEDFNCQAAMENCYWGDETSQRGSRDTSSTDVGNPSSERYWKNIIPQDYYIFYRDGVNTIHGVTVGGSYDSDILLNEYEGVGNTSEIQMSPSAFTFTHPNGTPFNITNTSGTVSNLAESSELTTDGREAYLMFVGSDTLRFPTNSNWQNVPGGMHSVNYSKELVVAYWKNETDGWVYDGNGGYEPLTNQFTPNSNDCILARIHATTEDVGIESIEEYGNYSSIDTSSEQQWIGQNEYGNTYYYPVLPRYNKYGKYDYDYENDTYDYVNNNIPFPLDGMITDEELNDGSLKINITSNQVESNVLDDLSGNQNHGFAFSDYIPNFDKQTLEPKKVKNTDRIRSSKNNGAF